jgi:hypothetical protein
MIGVTLDVHDRALATILHRGFVYMMMPRATAQYGHVLQVSVV